MEAGGYRIEMEKTLARAMKLTPPFLLLAIAILVSGCSDEVALRSDKPLTRAVASRKLSDFPFPASAHSIYYLIYAGGMQDLELYVRFDVDPEELDSSVDSLVAWNNNQMSRNLGYPSEALSEAKMPAPGTKFPPMPWWDPSTVAAGYHRGHPDSHALQILVDQERSRVYVYQND